MKEASHERSLILWLFYMENAQNRQGYRKSLLINSYRSSSYRLSIAYVWSEVGRVTAKGVELLWNE